MEKEVLQNFYDRTELDGAGKNETLETREVLALEKLKNTFLGRLTSELTEEG